MSTHLSFDAVAERLLEERGVDINFVGGYDESQVASSSLHHAVLKPDTVALQRLLAVPGIELGLFAAGQSPFGLACAHGRVEAMKVLLNTGRVDINTSEFGDPPIFQAVERGQLEAIDPNLENQLLQAPLALAAQGAHLRVVDALLADPRLSPCGLTRALDFASSDSVRRVIQRKIDDFGTPVSGPAQSSQQRTSTFLNCKY
ncbi:hypothetical protein N7448_011036 [Penicillium atrosanguineum]|nr:hypothetical protein N7448_011036 [Penicillium atrosanguineum]